MLQSNPALTHGDLAMIFAYGGLAQGWGFLLGGMVLIPALGPRLTLLLGCCLFTLSPLLTYACLVTTTPVSVLYVVYGLLTGFSINIIMLVCLTLPVTWFPDHRGKVIGFICGGFGLSSTVFAPLQSVLVNPENVAPDSSNITANVSSYFTDQHVLDNVPHLMLYLTAIYAVVYTVGLVLVVGAPSPDSSSTQLKISERLKSAALYMYKDGGRGLDFYLLWITRFLYLTVGAGVLAHWKTFSFTQSDDDQVVSLVGGVSGVLNFLSRVVAGVLIDKIGYSRLMSATGLLLTINLATIYFVGQYFIGIVISVWLVYFLGFAHFATIPFQVAEYLKQRFAFAISFYFNFNSNICF